ncbi:MAG: CocE/NonD family hydrolase [Rhodovibrionaceae bacterium]
MKSRRDLPHRVGEIEHIEIPMSDGCKLAARIWLPENAEDAPVPAIFEYIPYRKNDMTVGRDSATSPYVAGHGYAVVRVDLRGSGDSEGVLEDEYLQQELDDGCEAIQWIADQSWCDGQVGMIGISWGGFNGLQIAAMQPPALKAVITCCSTDDRYADDVHYMGGCLLIDNLSWASIMFGRNTLPPDPRHKGEAWRDLWMQRLKGSGLWLKNWLRHQHRDAFWKHGSVCEDFGKIQVPVYAVSGWADGYCRSVFRLMENLEGPRKGLVGPWAHAYPHIAEPGPAIGFLQESLRWWDHWLKGAESGIMEEPMLRLYMQEPAPPKSNYAERAGRWVAEPSWPSHNIERRTATLGGGGELSLTGETLSGAALQIQSPLTVGHRGGKWCSYAAPGDQPVEQGPDDAGSLVFESAPLSEDLEIAGDPNLDLSFSCAKPVAMVAVRLVDVAPDGAGTRVSYGLLNLTHRDSHESPEPLAEGARYTTRVPMKHVAQRFAKGHRIRLSISTVYWPVAWPAPEAVSLTVHTADSSLELPCRAPRREDAELRPFAEAEQSLPQPSEQLIAPKAYWRVIEDLGTDGTRVEIADGLGTFHLAGNDLTVINQGYETYSAADNDYASLTGEIRWEIGLARDDWRVSTVTETTLTSDAQSFHIEARLRAWEGEDLAYEESWSETLPRRLL